MPYKTTKFGVQTRQGAGPVDKKGFKIPKNVMRSCLTEAPGRALARTGAERGIGLLGLGLGLLALVLGLVIGLVIGLVLG